MAIGNGVNSGQFLFWNVNQNGYCWAPIIPPNNGQVLLWNGTDPIWSDFSSGGWTLLAGIYSTYQFGGWVTIGGASINVKTGSKYTFKAILNAAIGRTSYIRLWNQTDAIEVDGTSINSNLNIPNLVSASLTGGTTIGFPVGEKIYLLQIKADSGATAQSVVSCLQSEVR